MRLRRRRRSLVMWSSYAGPPGRYGAPRFTPPARSRRIRRWIRNGALLAVIGVIRLATTARGRWLLAGGVLTVVGLILRNGAGSVVLLPGLMFLLFALLTPSGPREARIQHSELERELATYSTPAQRRDLEATLDQYPDGITYELRDILASQTMAACDNRWPSVGRH
jgi:hypothetical protein